ncbi:MAG: leucine dehydrogenase, partial [Longimicrobiaceae bacterium]
FVINGGGLINVYGELNGWAPEQSMRKAGEIYTTLLEIFELARENGIPPSEAAERAAERRIDAIGKLQRTWV